MSVSGAPNRKFPNGFLWGTATASYQIEGAYNEDGRGESIWDRFSKTPGKVFEGHTGDVACDHYHLYKDDVALMKELGVSTYRFSIAWPRIFPTQGRYNEKGFEFYKRLIDELVQQCIKPAATMYHWDLPQWIEDKGGWVNRDTVEYFMEYVDKLYQVLGADIPSWITHNEPWCAAFLGYAMGQHAPGLTDWGKGLIASHHLLLSHGRAVQAYRQSGLKGEIGITLNLNHVDTVSDAPEDQAARFAVDGFQNRWFLDPLYKGQYPQDMVEKFSPIVNIQDYVQTGDLNIISTPTDFLGVNYYTRARVKANPESMLFGIEMLPPENAVTDMGWEVHPESLYRLLKRLDADYTKSPLYITENGAAYVDNVENGEVRDIDRLEFLRTHFEAAHRFIEEGGNLRGYFVWSFMDNFEWAFGYSKRFGIVYVDYETQERILKDSAKWYRSVIQANAIVQPTATV